MKAYIRVICYNYKREKVSFEFSTFNENNMDYEDFKNYVTSAANEMAISQCRSNEYDFLYVSSIDFRR